MDAQTTSSGTPCSPSWDDAWIATIEAAEQSLGHRICGARTIAGNPCPLPPNHANGRCKFHGGFNLTGAQPGNRNAVIHGLYSRALRPCDPSCPMWDKCPCADDAVKALPAPDRPTCPYEAAHYNAAFTDALARAPHNSDDEPHPIYIHLCHQTAILATMMQRAASVLREQSLVDTTSATGEKYAMESIKPSASLQALLRISSEYRAYWKLLNAHPTEKLNHTQLREHDRRTRHDTELEPGHQAKLEKTLPPAEIRAQDLIERAEHYLDIGYLRGARESFDAAQFLAPHLTEPKRAEFDSAFAALEQPAPSESGESDLAASLEESFKRLRPRMRPP